MTVTDAGGTASGTGVGDGAWAHSAEAVTTANSAKLIANKTRFSRFWIIMMRAPLKFLQRGRKLDPGPSRRTAAPESQIC
jgi:hypothetical protein